MKKFTNIGKMMDSVSFADGTTIYLRSGESTESNVAAIKVSAFILVEDVQKTKAKVKIGE